MVYGREHPLRYLFRCQFSRNLGGRRLSEYIVAMPPIESNQLDCGKTGLAEGPDPELEQLPAPRHPWRRTTILSLLLCFAASLALLLGLRGELAYSFRSGPPQSIGALATLTPNLNISNRWVQAEGDLEEHGGIRYERPFESDTFRLVPVQGNPKMWVQIRIPSGFEDEHFVPPNSFVGRLSPVGSLGLRYSALSDAVQDAGWPQGQLPTDAWVLIDGESPGAIRWVLALSLVLLGFAGFSLWATTAALRPARSN